MTVENHSEAGTDGRQLVVFRLGDEEYALPITCVQEIIRYSEPRSVASKDPSVRGVINLRGNIVPVYDLKHRLGLPAGAVAGAKIAIVDHDDVTAGIIVDEVTEVLTISVDEFEDVPAADDTAIEGVAKVGDRLIVLLEPSAALVATDAVVATGA